ncbi:MAG: zinc ribbon domain-containing protein [Longimicrobiales bacterium]|nr:zinc ribbon domain-containing protein [Longimicrobiales bacterium]
MENLPYLIGGGLLAAGVVLYVLLPLVRGIEAPLERSAEEYSEDQFRKQVALAALRDVEYDFATGKMDEEDYRELKAELSAEALRILETLRDEEEKAAAGERAGGAGPDGEAEEESGVSDEELDVLEEEIARIRRGLQEGRACRSCAFLNPPGSRFCGRCGEELEGVRASRDQATQEAS